MRRVITKRPIWVNSEITMIHAVHTREITTFWVNRRQIGLFDNGITVWKTHLGRPNLLIGETVFYNTHMKKFVIRIRWAALNVCNDSQNYIFEFDSTQNSILSSHLQFSLNAMNG